MTPDSPKRGSTHEAQLAYALTGCVFSLDASSTDQLLTQLTGLGWPRERIIDHATSRTTQGMPWPHPLGEPPLKPAQFAAALTQLRTQLGLSQPQRVRDHRQPLTQADRRLLDDVPPHHGT